MRPRRIHLTQGQFSVVSEKHYADLAQFKWHARWSPLTKSYYAARNVRLQNGKWTVEYMARRIMGLKHGDPRQVDHKNHDTLDNRPGNLRIVTSRENNSNRKHHSKYGVGVCRAHSRFGFVARAWHKGKEVCLGTFATPAEAQEARRKWLKNLT